VLFRVMRSDTCIGKLRVKTTTQFPHTPFMGGCIICHDSMFCVVVWNDRCIIWCCETHDYTRFVILWLILWCLYVSSLFYFCNFGFHPKLLYFIWEHMIVHIGDDKNTRVSGYSWIKSTTGSQWILQIWTRKNWITNNLTPVYKQFRYGIILHFVGIHYS